jgi:hypothetical protein
VLQLSLSFSNPQSKNNAVILSERSESKDLRLLFGALKGHGFSRATIHKLKKGTGFSPYIKQRRLLKRQNADRKVRVRHFR